MTTANRYSWPSPELELVIRAATTAPDRFAAHAERLLSPALNWSSVIQIALLRHRVLPLVYHTLTATAPDKVPEPDIATMRAECDQNAQHNMLLAVRALEIVGLLEAHGLPAMPFKGPALTEMLYGDLALRQFGDLDVLVHPDHSRAASAVLHGAGYELAIAPRAREKARYLFHYNLVFTRDDLRSIAQKVPHPPVLELHWRFANPYFAFEPDFDALWRRLGTGSLSGVSIRTLPPADLVLVLAVHGGKHCWRRLKWLCDMAQLLDRCPDLDWDHVIDRAAALGVQRLVLVALFLAHELLGAPLPHPVRAAVQRDSMVLNAALRLQRDFISAPEGPMPQPATQLAHLDQRERLRDRIRYCLRSTVPAGVIRQTLPLPAQAFLRIAIAFVPNGRDWSALPLPQRLFGFYYVYRPLRLLASRGLVAARRVVASLRSAAQRRPPR